MQVSIGGQVIFEYGDVKRSNAFIRKSVLAMLYGKYFAEGKDRPEQDRGTIWPERCPAVSSDRKTCDAVQSTNGTLRHLSSHCEYGID